MRYQPDILAKNLDVIFCGVNPALTAADAGHNFSHHTNRFWSVIHAAGFTDVRLQAQDEIRLLDFRCGITAFVERPTRRADEVSSDEFQKARLGFEAKMRRYAPRVIAFLGKRAFASMAARSKVTWGEQRGELAGAKVWILPNPSGLNRSFTREALIESYTELRKALKNCYVSRSFDTPIRV
jgi:TDG/mug DNA glycosylase family protein